MGEKRRHSASKLYSFGVILLIHQNVHMKIFHQFRLALLPGFTGVTNTINAPVFGHFGWNFLGHGNSHYNMNSLLIPMEE